MNNENLKKITMTGMLCAVAYISMALIHLKLVPSAPFLTYDPKDVIIAIGGFIFGPVYAVIISVVVSALEMITISESGIIGFVMQVIASFSFAFTAAAIYNKRRTKKTAFYGLVVGTLCMSAVMLLWNYLLTPIYMGASRSTVAAMLLPAILPFNLAKGILNTALTMLIYKPLVTALRKMGLVSNRK